MDRTLGRLLGTAGLILVLVAAVSFGIGRWMVERGSMMPTTEESTAARPPAVPKGSQVIVLRDEEKAKPLTTFEYLTLVTTSVGFAGGIATLIFLIVQTRAATESVKLTVREAIMSRTQDIHRIFIENPELRPYFYEGKHCDADGRDYARVRQMTELLCDFYDSLLMQHQLYPDAWQYTRWQRYVEDILLSSPVLREYLSDKEVREWYRRGTPGHPMPDLITVLERVEARLPSQHAVLNTTDDTHDSEQRTTSRRGPANPNPQAGPSGHRRRD